MKSKIRVGIIGCGGIANAHVDGYRNNGIVPVALADVNPEAAQKLSAKCPGARVFTDYRALINSGRVDAVSVCSPPVAHEAAVVFALKHGIHVLCEKPLAHHPASARRMQAAAKKSKALLMTAFRHRFLPAIVKMRQLIDAGTIGKLVLFQNIFCGPAFGMNKRWFSKKAIAGGGSLLDTNSHSVDLFRYLVGEVAGQHALMHRHLKGTDVEDAGILVVKSKSGVVGSLASAWVAGSGAADIDIFGQGGRMIYDYTQPDVIRFIKLGQKEWTSVKAKPSGGFAEQIAHFLGAVRRKNRLTCTGHDGLRAVEIIHATY